MEGVATMAVVYRPPPAIWHGEGVGEWVEVAVAAQVAAGQIVDAAHGDVDLVVWRTFEGEPCVM